MSYLAACSDRTQLVLADTLLTIDCDDPDHSQRFPPIRRIHSMEQSHRYLSLFACSWGNMAIPITPFIESTGHCPDPSLAVLSH